MILNVKRMFLSVINKKRDCRTCFDSQSNALTSDSNVFNSMAKCIL